MSQPRPHNAPAAALHLQGVTRGFAQAQGRLEILRDLELRVDAGEMVALVGPSGSGKTTLLQIAGLLALPDSGQVRVGGLELSTANDAQRTKARREHIGFVYQFHHLLPELTALENVLMPLWLRSDRSKEAHKQAQTLLEKVGLGHRVAHRPAELSGGECQRVAIARALIARPSLVLADEPTGNLDPHTAAEVFTVLRDSLRESGAGALIATHNLELARGMDRVVQMSEGRVITLN